MKRHMGALSRSPDPASGAFETRSEAEDVCGEVLFDTLFEADQESLSIRCSVLF